MGRQNSKLTATITIDLKDRSGITRTTGIKLGVWEQLEAKFSILAVNKYEFDFTDDGLSKVTALADKVFDTYFDEVIYPAVQGFRVLYPHMRCNVNIAITGWIPYKWTKVKYYTGEYITFIPIMPKFDAYHHAYYVARALFSGTSLSEVSANLQHTLQAAEFKTDYDTMKALYTKACVEGTKKVKCKVNGSNCDGSASHLILGPDDWQLWYSPNMRSSKHIRWIDQVWWRSHHAGEAITNYLRKPEEEKSVLDENTDNSLFLDDEGYFDIEALFGGDSNV